MNSKSTKSPVASQASVPVGDFPIGAIIPFGGNPNANAVQLAGWMICNGNTVSRADFPELYAIIGNNFGNGDGQSTFDLPDFRGTFQRGVSGATTNDPDAATRTAAATGGSIGNSVGSVQGYATGRPTNPLITNSTGIHSHTANHLPDDNSSSAVAGSYQAVWNDGAPNCDPSGDHYHRVNGGGDEESRPLNVAVYFLIKFRQVS